MRSRLSALFFLLAAVGCASAGGGDDATRMAAQHAGDRPVPTAAAAREPASAVRGDETLYARVGERDVRGYLALPAQPPAAGIILIHEWWGLNDNIRSIARQLAGEGYAALAVDLYEGAAASDPEAARGLMQSAAQREPALLDNLRQAREFLVTKQGAREVGVIGWCFGGGWALRTALDQGAQVDATVVYYGRLVSDESELRKLHSPLLGIFGGADEGIPVESVQAFEQTLARLGKPATIHIYAGAAHAFANPSGTRYDAAAAEDAWGKTLAFFADHLGSQSLRPRG
jgi:carboxymethylenebutenolidase